MTHPNHRRKGLFCETGKRTLALAREEGIQFVFGFPRETSLPGLVKLGWSTNGRFNAYDLLVPTVPLAVVASHIAAVKKIHGDAVARAVKPYRTAYDPPSNSVIEPGIGGVYRDSDLIHYKPETDSRFVLDIDGTKLWISMHDGTMGIGDIGPIDDAVELRRVIKALRSICFRAGILRMVTYLSPKCRLDRLFREAGFKPRKGLPICYLDLGSGLPLDDFKFVYGDFDTF